jgi:hypothetical protein
MKFRFEARALLVIPALVLAACGGGGGGGGDDGGGGGTPALESTLVVSDGNAKPVAADGLDATSNGAAVSAGGGLITGVQVSPSAPGGVVAPSLPSVAFKLATMAANRPAVAAGVVITPQTEVCALGGTITVSGNVSGGSSLVAGDTLSITANNCTETVDYAATTLNGSLRIDISRGRFDPNSTSYPKSITMQLTASNLAMDRLGVVNVSTGDMKIELNQTSASTAVTTLSGNSLTNTWSHDTVTRSSSLRGYRIRQESFGSQLTTNIQASVVSSHPLIGTDVVYQVSTPRPLITDLALVVSGSIKVTGVDSGLLLTITTVDNFTLEVDADGDGTYETSTTTTTAELRGLL